MYSTPGIQKGSWVHIVDQETGGGGHPASITAQTVVLRTLEDQEGVLF